MKKFHVHVGVKDLKEAVNFYSAMFGENPVKEKSDYAKWEPKDSHLVFAVSTRAKSVGVDHLGFRVESEEELKGFSERLKKAELAVYDEGETTCCYTKSNKAWVQDPAGIPWEAYQNMEDVQVFHEAEEERSCCTPASMKTSATKKSTSCCG